MKKLRYVISSDVEDLAYRLECAVQTLSAVHDAMENGSFSAESYIRAFFGCYCHLSDLSDELNKMVEDATVLGSSFEEATA